MFATITVWWALLRWEIQHYFSSPVYWLFSALFLALANSFVLLVGGWLSQNQADLRLFFTYIPWIFLILIPALTMNGWSDDKKYNRIEILRSLPVGAITQTVIRFRAGLAFITMIVISTTFLWITASYLGNPDHGVIISSYIGLIFLVSAYLAVAYFISSLTQHPLLAFVGALAANFVLSFLATSAFQVFFIDWTPGWALNIITLFSPFAHYQGFTEGFISVISLLFFISLIVYFLVLTSWQLFNLQKKRDNILKATGIFIAFVAVLSFFPPLGWDISSDQRHTLPKNSIEYLKKYPIKVEITLYYSPEIGESSPVFVGIYKRIRFRLERYQQLNPENITFKIVKVEAYSENEDKAIADGMKGIPFDSSGQLGYFGLALTSENSNVATIPFIDSLQEQRIDYDLLKLFSSLKPRELNPHIGIITALPIIQSSTTTNTVPVFISELISKYKLTPINTAERLAETWPDLLLIIQPGLINAKFMFAIEQYLLKKGRAVILLDPYQETAQDGGFGYTDKEISDNSQSLNSILDGWGISIDSNNIVLDRTHAEFVNIEDSNGSRSIPLPSWIKIEDDMINNSDPLISDSGTLLFASAGSINAKPSEGLNFTYLIKTSSNGRLESRSVFKQSLQPPIDIGQLLTKTEDEKAYTLAARLQGTIKSQVAKPILRISNNRFSNKDSAGKKAFAKLLNNVATESEKDLDVVIIAESDFLLDRFWVQKQRFLDRERLNPIFGNGFFMLSTIEALLQEFSLQNLRSRQLVSRPFTVIENIRHKATVELRQEENTLLEAIVELKVKAIEAREKQSKNSNSSSVVENYTEDNKLFAELKTTRDKLRKVERSLNTQINTISNIIKLLLILVLPICFLTLGLLWYWLSLKLDSIKIKKLLSKDI